MSILLLLLFPVWEQHKLRSKTRTHTHTHTDALDRSFPKEHSSPWNLPPGILAGRRTAHCTFLCFPAHVFALPPQNVGIHVAGIGRQSCFVMDSFRCRQPRTTCTLINSMLSCAISWLSNDSLMSFAGAGLVRPGGIPLASRTSWISSSMRFGLWGEGSKDVMCISGTTCVTTPWDNDPLASQKSVL